MISISSTDRQSGVARPDRKHNRLEAAEREGWRLVPLPDYQPPSESQPDALRKKWRFLSQRLRKKPLKAVQPETDLCALPPARLEAVAPPIDWTPAVTALQQALATSNHAPSTNGVVFLIGQPYCEHATILNDWAAARGAERLHPPSTEQILTQDRRWLATCQTAAHSWVLPTLERCFLRHSRGLVLLRAFLEQALSGALGPGVIGCDSWAWAYIQRVWPMHYANTLTLQAFDAQTLGACLLTLSGDHQADMQFLSARTGKPLSSAQLTDPTDHDHSLGRELRQLSADCRGNLGVAWHHWRQRLRTHPTAEADDGAESPSASDDQVWVSAETQAPVLLGESSEDVIFILHALLLHDGLSSEVLAELLPFPHSRTLSCLLELRNAAIVIEQHGVWRVAALAYPSARDLLHGQSYLCDAF